jgi:hypothetical protein
MKQTAVEWLQQALMTKEDADNYNQWAFNKAKAMEKEQIKNAWINSLTKGDFNSADEYYNKTFKSE